MCARIATLADLDKRQGQYLKKHFLHSAVLNELEVKAVSTGTKPVVDANG